LADECPSIQKWVLTVSPSSPTENERHDNKNDEESPSWRSQKVLNLRRNVERGLALHDHVELSNAVLPLELPWQLSRSPHAPMKNSRFVLSACVGAALETATLPYRLTTDNNNRGGSRHLIGLNGYYYGGFDAAGSPFGTTTTRLTLADFLNTLKPSAKHSVLELDAYLPSPSLAADSSIGYQNNNIIWARLREGTSVERDPRVPPQRGDSRSSEKLPGSWLLPPDSGGMMFPMSPIGFDNTHSAAENVTRSTSWSSRLQHHHFALSTAIRPTASSRKLKSDAPSTPKYVTCLMEGMGVCYRPEQSMACAVEQSLGGLVRDGYAAGSYWKHVWAACGAQRDAAASDKPMLSALGNTSRRYPQLHGTASNLKDSLSPKLRGFYNRDAMNGLLPEIDDCDEALSFCMDLRDIYRPPEGAENEEGSYFSD